MLRDKTRRYLGAAVVALVLGSAVLGAIALMHISNMCYASLEVHEMLTKIDTAFADKMREYCGGENATWRVAPAGKGYECLDKRGYITRRFKTLP